MSATQAVALICLSHLEPEMHQSSRGMLARGKTEFPGVDNTWEKNCSKWRQIIQPPKMWVRKYHAVCQAVH